MTDGADRSPVVDQPDEHPSDSGRPGLVHVSELLAAHGRSAAPAGGRRRRAAEPETAGSDPVDPETVESSPQPRAPVEDAVVDAAPSLENITAVQQVPVVEPERGNQPAPDPAADVVSKTDERQAGGIGEWVVVIGQLVGVLVVGAALWFGFRYLWGQVPVLAAVLATLLTIGLVVGVRVLRRDTDLLSSALAVVAGLVVAFSPPVLALTGG